MSIAEAAPGDLDLTFNAGAIVNSNASFSNVNAVAVQPDGKILIGGYFTSVNGSAQSLVARLNADGSLDLSFNSPVMSNSNFGGVNALALQPDGKILVGGHFLIGTEVKNTVRLNSNGSLDGTFGTMETGGSFVSVSPAAGRENSRRRSDRKLRRRFGARNRSAQFKRLAR